MISNRASKPNPPPENDTKDEWLDEMRSFYLRNGFYRTQDVRRVIGAPWENVVVSEPKANKDWLEGDESAS